MKHKRVYISIFLLILAAACVYFFDNSRLRYNGFSTTHNGVSLEYATHADVFLYPVEIGRLYGYIDQYGDMIISRQYTNAGDFSCGLASAQQNDQFGYIDSTGRWVIPPQFTLASTFSENLATVLVDDQFGYIDLSGQLVYPPQFSATSRFVDGTAWVAKYRFRWMRSIDRILDANVFGDSYYIDMHGHYISKPVYTPQLPPPSGHDVFPYKQNDRWSLRTSNGEVILPPTYGHIYEFHGPLALFSLNGESGYINYKGEVVWPKTK